MKKHFAPQNENYITASVVAIAFLLSSFAMHSMIKDQVAYMLVFLTLFIIATSFCFKQIKRGGMRENGLKTERQIADQIKKHFDDCKVLSDVSIGNENIDVLVVKENIVMLIEVKNFRQNLYVEKKSVLKKGNQVAMNYVDQVNRQSRYVKSHFQPAHLIRVIYNANDRNSSQDYVSGIHVFNNGELAELRKIFNEQLELFRQQLDRTVTIEVSFKRRPNDQSLLELFKQKHFFYDKQLYTWTGKVKSSEVSEISKRVIQESGAIRIV